MKDHPRAVKQQKMAARTEPDTGTADPPPTTAWLIERAMPDGPAWFFSRDKGDGQYAMWWTDNASDAVKFETRDEADAWRLEISRIVPGLLPEKESVVTEHEWCGP